MSDLATTKRKFKTILREKQNVSDAIPALLGKGNGEVVVLNQPGQVYIRVGNEESFGTAFNNRVPNSDNLPVFVGYDTITDADRRLFQVLSIRQTAYVDAGNTPIPQIGPHHTTHEFGGGDDIYIEWRRLMGLRVGRPVAFVVTVDWGYIYRSGSWIKAPTGSTTVDLTAEQAALVGTQAQLILISLDSGGALEQTNGTVVASPAALTISDCPTPPAGNIPLAAVRIYATQTAIGDSPSAPDIIDLRFPTFNSMNNGGVAGLTMQVQFNDAGVFGADADFTWDKTVNSLLVGGAHGLGALGDNSIINTGDGHSATHISVVYGTNNPAFAGFKARGTFAAPTKALTDDYLLTVGGRGYATAGWESGARGSFNILAAEDHDTTHGTYATIRTTAIGAIATTEVARFDNASGIKNAITNLYTTKDYVLTIPATGTAALLATANVFTLDNKINGLTIGRGSGNVATNTAIGYSTLVINTTGYKNTAVGAEALLSNTDGYHNTASGQRALISNDGGYGNTASGVEAGGSIISGFNNTFLGYQAGSNALQEATAENSMALGNGTYTDASNQVVIGNSSVTQTILRSQLKLMNGAGYMTADVVAATGVTTFATSPAGGFVFTPAVTFSDNIGIGIAPSYRLHVEKIFSGAYGAGDALKGQWFQTTYTSASSISTGSICGPLFQTSYQSNANLFKLYGSFFEAYHEGTGRVDNIYGAVYEPANHGTGTVGTLMGFITQPLHSGSGLIDVLYGFQANPIVSSTGNVTLISGFIANFSATAATTINTSTCAIINTPSLSGGATVSGVHTGLYIADQRSIGSTSYALQSIGGDIKFDNTKVGINRTATTNPLEVAGSIHAIGSSATYIICDAPDASNTGLRLRKAGVDSWYVYQPASSTDLRFYNGALAATFTPAGALTVVGAFGCNGATAQTAYASGGALAAYGAGANGLDSGANMSAMHAMVVAIRAALVANGIMS